MLTPRQVEKLDFLRSKTGLSITKLVQKWLDTEYDKMEDTNVQNSKRK